MGHDANQIPSPEGTVEVQFRKYFASHDKRVIRPSLRDAGNVELAPALKRRAILTMSLRDPAPSSSTQKPDARPQTPDPKSQTPDPKHQRVAHAACNIAGSAFTAGFRPMSNPLLQRQATAYVESYQRRKQDV